MSTSRLDASIRIGLRIADLPFTAFWESKYRLLQNVYYGSEAYVPAQPTSGGFLSPSDGSSRSREPVTQRWRKCPNPMCIDSCRICMTGSDQGACLQFAVFLVIQGNPSSFLLPPLSVRTLRILNLFLSVFYYSADRSCRTCAKKRKREREREREPYSCAPREDFYLPGAIGPDLSNLSRASVSAQ